MECSICGGKLVKNGKKNGRQRYYCRTCRKEFLDINKETIIPEKTAGITEDQFRAKFDLRYIVDNKCKELKEGMFLSMGEFIRFCCISATPGYRDVLLHTDFDQYRGKIRGDFYWSHPKSITKMKNEGILN